MAVTVACTEPRRHARRRGHGAPRTVPRPTGEDQARTSRAVWARTHCAPDPRRRWIHTHAGLTGWLRTRPGGALARREQRAQAGRPQGVMSPGVSAARRVGTTGRAFGWLASAADVAEILQAVEAVSSRTSPTPGLAPSGVSKTRSGQLIWAANGQAGGPRAGAHRPPHPRKGILPTAGRWRRRDRPRAGAASSRQRRLRRRR